MNKKEYDSVTKAVILLTKLYNVEVSELEKEFVNFMFQNLEKEDMSKLLRAACFANSFVDFVNRNREMVINKLFEIFDEKCTQKIDIHTKPSSIALLKLILCLKEKDIPIMKNKEKIMTDLKKSGIIK